MEYKHFLPHLASYLPVTELSNNTDFKFYLFSNGSKILYEISDFMMMTLPSPRAKYYQSSNYDDI